jgi:methanethiol S-methyltransferase
LSFLFYNEFYDHFYSYLTGGITSEIIVSQWHIVLINVVLFMFFFAMLSFRRKAKWSEYGLVGAFFVSLFVEMYGIPLTFLFTMNYFLGTTMPVPKTLMSFDFLGVSFGLDIGMVYGAAMILLGMALIALGWVTLYRNVKKGLVTAGIYSYSRHPQYLGFLLITIGWFIGWPSIITLIFSPVLVYKYLDLCRKEEKEVTKEHPSYAAYRKRVPFFF